MSYDIISKRGQNRKTPQRKKKKMIIIQMPPERAEGQSGAQFVIGEASKQQTNFITRRAADTIRASHYTHGPWGDEFICVTQRWALHVLIKRQFFHLYNDRLTGVARICYKGGTNPVVETDMSKSSIRWRMGTGAAPRFWKWGVASRKIFDSPRFGQWGTKYCLDSQVSLIRPNIDDTALTLV